MDFDVCHLSIDGVYGSQILCNVENLTINYKVHDSIIKCVVKLRRLELFVAELTFHQATNILSMLESILDQRNNGQITEDFIEIRFRWRDLFQLFTEKNRSDSIKLFLDSKY